jgi:hypothetical protein
VVLTDLPMRNAGKCGWANSGLRDSDLVWACILKLRIFAEAALFGPAGLVRG